MKAKRADDRAVVARLLDDLAGLRAAVAEQGARIAAFEAELRARRPRPDPRAHDSPYDLGVGRKGFRP